MRLLLILSDWTLHIIHLGLTLFCLLGWIFPATQFAHLVLAVLIAFSWFVLGRFIEGTGYCPVTDLQWRVKEKLGCRPGSSSFIQFQLEQVLGRELDAARINQVTQVVFFISLGLSLYVNLVHKLFL